MFTFKTLIAAIFDSFYMVIYEHFNFTRFTYVLILVVECKALLVVFIFFPIWKNQIGYMQQYVSHSYAGERMSLSRCAEQ